MRSEKLTVMFPVTYFPWLSVGWFIILVLTTSAGVPIMAATSPAHMLLQHTKLINHKRSWQHTALLLVTIWYNSSTQSHKPLLSGNMGVESLITMGLYTTRDLRFIVCEWRVLHFMTLHDWHLYRDSCQQHYYRKDVTCGQTDMENIPFQEHDLMASKG